MRKLLLITGDIAAGKSTFSNILSVRYGAAVFQKDTIKEILGDYIGFRNRKENKVLSNTTIELMCHIFSHIAPTGQNVILEANFHEEELEKLHSIACEYQYNVFTLVLRGDTDVLYHRYMHRMNEENRHPVHLSTTLDRKEDFVQEIKGSRSEKVAGESLVINATDFSYQENPVILRKIDMFMEKGVFGILQEEQDLERKAEILPGYDFPDEIRRLFSEYTGMLVEGDPSFQKYLDIQHYDEELEHLHAKYGLPDGRLYIVFYGGEAAGCIGLRKLDEQNCEMKRLYVRPAFRRKHIGKKLVQKIIGDAKEIGYSHMFLDTLPFLENAVDLYKACGFYEIPSYNNSPVETSIYMKLDL